MTRETALALVSLKTYFSHAQTLEWCAEAFRIAGRYAPHVRLLILPSVTALSAVSAHAKRAGVDIGAQDCSWAPPGATTGEIPAALLRELGASAVMIGHAERRTDFGDDDSVVALKVAAVVENGMLPVVCVGERDRDADPTLKVVDQLQAAMARVSPTEPVVALYEPAWAIGADAPASVSHIRTVATALREAIASRGPTSSVLYGGSAGPGVFTQLGDVLDGLGLGRRVHDPRSLELALEEMAGVVSSTAQPWRTHT